MECHPHSPTSTSSLVVGVVQTCVEWAGSGITVSAPVDIAQLKLLNQLTGSAQDNTQETHIVHDRDYTE